MAAKVHYFGVGGGVADFVNFVRNQKIFSVESTITHKTGQCIVGSLLTSDLKCLLLAPSL